MTISCFSCACTHRWGQKPLKLAEARNAGKAMPLASLSKMAATKTRDQEHQTVIVNWRRSKSPMITSSFSCQHEVNKGFGETYNKSFTHSFKDQGGRKQEQQEFSSAAWEIDTAESFGVRSPRPSLHPSIPPSLTPCCLHLSPPSLFLFSSCSSAEESLTTISRNVTHYYLFSWQLWNLLSFKQLQNSGWNVLIGQFSSAMTGNRANKKNDFPGFSYMSISYNKEEVPQTLFLGDSTKFRLFCLTYSQKQYL